MKVTKYVFVLALLACFSCNDKEDRGDLSLNVKLQYNGEPVVMFDNYIYPDGQDFFFSRFSFYMSDIDLGNGALDGIYFLNTTSAHNTLEDAVQGFDYFIRDLPEGDYSQFSFKVGIPADINATSPSDYSSDSDLSLTAEHWPSWESYIFSKTEGKLDSNGDGMYDTGFAFHIGSDPALRTVNLNKDFTITNGEISQMEIIIEMDKIFEGPSGLYDILAMPNPDQLSEIDAINEIADNVATAIN